MAKPKVCISFDFENDKDYRNLISAWDANSDIDFAVNDKTPSEISSYDISRIKAVLTTKISEAKVLLVISGDHINSKHPDSKEIGCVNWQNWECQKALELEKGIVLVKLTNENKVPDELYGRTADRIDVIGFEKDKIIEAIIKCT